MAKGMAAVRQEWACWKPTCKWRGLACPPRAVGVPFGSCLCHQLGSVFHSLTPPLHVPGGNHRAEEMPGGLDFSFYFFYILQVWKLENVLFNFIVPFPGFCACLVRKIKPSKSLLLGSGATSWQILAASFCLHFSYLSHTVAVVLLHCIRGIFVQELKKFLILWGGGKLYSKLS